MNAVLFKMRLLIDRLSIRERTLLLLSLVLIIFGLSYGALWYLDRLNPGTDRRQIEQFQRQTEQNRVLLLTLERAESNPQLQTLNQQNERLRQDIEVLDARINAITGELIPPNTMASVLRQLLGNSDLTLVRFNALPAQAANLGEPGAPTLYRHQLDIELTGTFDALSSYLTVIEALPWRLFWDELSVETEQYPALRIRLKVHTLSDQEAWLNV